MNNRLEGIINDFGVLPEDTEEVKSFLSFVTKYGTSEEQNSAIQNYMQLYEKNKCQKLATVDELTKLYNKRKFNEDMKKETSKSKREKTDLSLVIFDIDHFKRFNDTYGHEVGDYVLETLSKSVKKITRDYDMIYRIGGEEFAILMPRMSSLDTFKFTKRIREELEKVNYKVANDKSTQVTISAGVASLKNTPNQNEKDLYKCADKALYDSKELTRNVVSIYRQ